VKCASATDGRHCFHSEAEGQTWGGIFPPPSRCCHCGMTPQQQHGPHAPRRGIGRTTWFAMVLLLALPVLAHAGEPVPATPCTEIAGFEPCAITWAGYAGSMTLFKPGSDRLVIAFSRVQADLRTGIAGSHLAVRIDTNAQPDGATSTTPASFQSIEARGAFYVPISSVVSLAAVGGASAPLLPTDGAIARKYPAMGGGGLLLGSPRGKTWVFCGAGFDEAAGKGVKFLFAVQIKLRGNVFLVADGSIGGAGSFARQGSALGVSH
jgi:hypothetical protein